MVKWNELPFVMKKHECKENMNIIGGDYRILKKALERSTTRFDTSQALLSRKVSHFNQSSDHVATSFF